jgi:hypothetical protein
MYTVHLDILGINHDFRLIAVIATNEIKKGRAISDPAFFLENKLLLLFGVDYDTSTINCLIKAIVIDYRFNSG